MQFKEAVEEFALSVFANGSSKATIKWYRSLLASFMVKHNDRELHTITPNEMREYIIGLRERKTRFVDAPQKPQQPGGLSPATVAGHITALHALWSWASVEYGIPNPMRNIKRAKQPTPQPKAISSEDFVRIFNATRNSAAGVRDRALLAFLADTGVRIGGIVSLKIENLDLDNKRALVTEKGGRTRKVFFTSITARFLLAWLSVRHSSSEFVFTSVVGARNALTASGIEQILDRLKSRAQVTGG